MTFEGLCFIALLLAVYLICVGINDAIELDNQKTEERRETFRQIAFADKRRAVVMQKNRDTLWQEVSHD